MGLVPRPRAGLLLLLVALTCAPGGLGRQLAAPAPSSNRVTDGLPELIPLKLLLGNSKQRNPQLSPDGKMIGYAAPSADGVMNVWIKRLPSAAEEQKLQRNVSLFEKPGTGADKQVTFDKRRGITAFSWSDAGNAIFYIQDKDGDENYHLYVVPLDGLFSGKDKKPQAIDLTPFPGVRASGIVGDKDHPNTLYIGLNKRDPEVFDMYKLDVPSRRLVLDTINPGDSTSWIMDYDFNIRGVSSYNNTDGATFVRVRDEGAPKGAGQGQSKLRGLDAFALFKEAAKRNLSDAEWIAASSSGSNVSAWRTLVNWPFGEDSGVFRFNRKGDGLYVVDSTGRDTTEFQLISTVPGDKAKVLKRYDSNPLVNVASVMFDPDTWEPQAISFNYHKPQWRFPDPAFKSEWEKIQSLYPNGVPSIADRSHDSQTWLIAYSFDNKTTAYYIYQRRGPWPPQKLLEVQPGLNKYVMAPMHSVVITARDGLKLPAYLTLPVKPGVPDTLPESITGKIPDLREPQVVAAAAAAAKSDKLTAEKAGGSGVAKLDLNLPMVLLVHGGPWARDSWGADAVVQWLANRGYAVLQVNYRGSTDYGKSFLNAGNKQWGTGSMQHDLTDSVKWAIAKGIADPKKICIMGGSYGGYATLAGLAFTPELYACGVDLVGVSNVGTFQKSIPAYWKPMLYELRERVGDAVHNEAFNRAISPYYHADKIRVPLLIGQGANDVRVPQRESDQMFKEMKKRGLDVTYIMYSDEGHGLVRPDNRVDYYSRVDQFLAKHLGGRAEPLIKMPDTTAKVITD